MPDGAGGEPLRLPQFPVELLDLQRVQLVEEDAAEIRPDIALELPLVLLAGVPAKRLGDGVVQPTVEELVEGEVRRLAVGPEATENLRSACGGRPFGRSYDECARVEGVGARRLLDCNMMPDQTVASRQGAVAGIPLGSGTSKTVISGLDPTSPWAARLSARSALFTELETLLAGLEEAPPRPGFRSRVIDDNVLARSSAAARAKLWEELSKRYVLDPEHPLFAAFWTEWRRCTSTAEQALSVYVLLALNDRLVADLGTSWLYPRLRNAPSELRVDNVGSFISQGSQHRPEVLAWSPKTRLSVAQHYLASIRDFGLARGVARKVSVRPALHAAPMRLLLNALRLVGRAPHEVLQAPEFRLLGVGPGEVVDTLAELNRRGDLRFRMQGDVIELET